MEINLPDGTSMPMGVIDPALSEFQESSKEAFATVGVRL